MGIEDNVVVAAEDILKNTSTGLTKEALVRQVAPRLPNRLLPAQIITILRKHPQRFNEGGDGRWRLRVQGGLPPLDEPPVATETITTLQQTLRQGCYVVFDLDAIGQDAHSHVTEIIHIDDKRCIDCAN